MRVQLWESRWCLAVALCLCGAAGSAARAQGTEATPTLTVVSAGLGGFVKAGRWAPVLVEIENPRGASSADLELTWGDATVRRHVVFGSPGTRRVEFFIRTADAGSVVRATLRSDAGEVAAERPVTVLAHDTPVTLCVRGIDAWLEDAERCTVTLAPQQLSGSVRGYEIVDDVLTADGRAVPEPLRVALERWRSLRALEASGDLSLTPQVTRPQLPRGLASSSAQAVRIFAGGYITVLLIIGVAGATTRVAPFWLWLGFVVVTLTAVGAAFALGRAGPGGRIIVHHTSLLQQIPGTNASLLTLRGIAEFPSDENIHLRVPREDAMLEPSAASGRSAQVFDEAGHPTLAGRYGFGTRQAFTAETVTDVQWLSVDEHDESVQVTNRTDDTLHDCRFGDGMSVTDVGDLPARAAVSARRLGDVAGPLLTCTATVPAEMLAEQRRAVEMLGTTTVAVYRDRRFSANRTEEPND